MQLAMESAVGPVEHRVEFSKEFGFQNKSPGLALRFPINVDVTYELERNIPLIHTNTMKISENTDSILKMNEKMWAMPDSEKLRNNQRFILNHTQVLVQSTAPMVIKILSISIHFDFENKSPPERRQCVNFLNTLLDLHKAQLLTMNVIKKEAEQLKIDLKNCVADSDNSEPVDLQELDKKLLYLQTELDKKESDVIFLENSMSEVKEIHKSVDEQLKTRLEKDQQWKMGKGLTRILMPLSLPPPTTSEILKKKFLKPAALFLGVLSIASTMAVIVYVS